MFIFPGLNIYLCSYSDLDLGFLSKWPTHQMNEFKTLELLWLNACLEDDKKYPTLSYLFYFLHVQLIPLQV